MPTLGASLREIRDTESMIRSAAKRYESNPGYLHRRQLPPLFHDIGLDPGISNDLGAKGSSRLNTFLALQSKQNDVEGAGADNVSMEELIDMQNHYIAKLDTTPQSERTELNFVSPKHRPSESTEELKQTPMEREMSLQNKVMTLKDFSQLLDSAEDNDLHERRLDRMERDEALWTPAKAEKLKVRLLDAAVSGKLDAVLSNVTKADSC